MRHDTSEKIRTVFKMIANPKTTFSMTNDYDTLSPTPPTDSPVFTMTYEQRLVIEDRLVEVFSEVIDLDDTHGAPPTWHGSTSQLMEVAWALSRMHRIIDHDTRRPMTMQRIATLLCRNLHRRLPANIYSVARQSRQTRRPSVVDHFGRLWFEDGLDPSTLLAGPEDKTTGHQPKRQHTS